MYCPIYRPCHQQHTTRQKTKQNHCCSHPNNMPPAQTAPVNRSNGDTPDSYQHQQKINHEHHRPHHRDKSAIHPPAPLYVYPYIAHPTGQPSREDHHKTPVGHDHPTYAHAPSHQHCQVHYNQPPSAIHAKNNRCCNGHGEETKPAQLQPRTCSYSSYCAKHGKSVKNDSSGHQHTCQCHTNHRRTSPKPTTRWVSGPPLPEFVVGRPMNAPKYKRG